MLPGMSGFEVLEQLRADEAGQDIAVLMLTARREEPDRIKGLVLGRRRLPHQAVLAAGARAARARHPAPHVAGAVGAARRRARSARSRSTARRIASRVDDAELDLTPTEFKLLLTLAERRGRVQARALLLETVWEAAPDIQTRTVDMHVQRLRTKLGAAGDLIETVRGFGYRLRAAQTRSA